MRATVVLLATLVLLLPAPASSQEPAPPRPAPWQAVIEHTLARKGVLLPDGVFRVGILRSDLDLAVRGTRVEDPIALTSWQFFRPAAGGTDVLVAGDLLLLPGEVNPVISLLVEGDFQVTGLHNHFLEDQPRLMDLHYEGRGPAGRIAARLRDAMAATGIPRYERPEDLVDVAPPSAEAREAYDVVQRLLGREGVLSRRALLVSFVRREPPRRGGPAAPLDSGAASALHFQWSDRELTACGELRVTREELTPVLRLLREGGLEIQAIHGHASAEASVFQAVHFWGRGGAERLATALRAAVDQIGPAR